MLKKLFFVVMVLSILTIPSITLAMSDLPCPDCGEYTLVYTLYGYEPNPQYAEPCTECPDGVDYGEATLACYDVTCTNCPYHAVERQFAWADVTCP